MIKVNKVARKPRSFTLLYKNERVLIIRNVIRIEQNSQKNKLIETKFLSFKKRIIHKYDKDK